MLAMLSTYSPSAGKLWSTRDAAARAEWQAILVEELGGRALRAIGGAGRQCILVAEACTTTVRAAEMYWSMNDGRDLQGGRDVVEALARARRAAAARRDRSRGPAGRAPRWRIPCGSGDAGRHGRDPDGPRRRCRDCLPSRRRRQCAWPCPGTLAPPGGICWLRILRTAFSNTSMFWAMSDSCIVSNATPPAQSSELWHSVQ